MFKRWLLWSLAHFCALVLLDNFLFLISHVPQVPLDAVILPLTDVGSILRFPSRVLRACWPFEDTPQILNWLLTVLNSLVWGGLMASGRRSWRRIRSQRF